MTRLLLLGLGLIGTHVAQAGGPPASSQEFTVEIVDGQPKVSTRPTSFTFVQEDCEAGYAYFSINNQTGADLTVSAALFGEDERGSGFGIAKEDGDSAALGDPATGLWHAVGFHVAAGETHERGVYYMPAKATFRMARQAIILTFGFADRALNDPDGNGFNDNVGGVVMLVGEALECDPSTEEPEEEPPAEGDPAEPAS